MASIMVEYNYENGSTIGPHHYSDNLKLMEELKKEGQLYDRGVVIHLNTELQMYFYIQHVIEVQYDAYGYSIVVDEDSEESFGNSRLESTEVRTLEDPYTMDVSEIRSAAYETAIEIAGEQEGHSSIMISDPPNIEAWEGYLLSRWYAEDNEVYWEAANFASTVQKALELLAKSAPPIFEGFHAGLGLQCDLCSALSDSGEIYNDENLHSETCIWRLTREYVANMNNPGYEWPRVPDKE